MLFSFVFDHIIVSHHQTRNNTMNLQGDYLSVWAFHDHDFMSDLHSKSYEFNDPLGQLYNIYTFQRWDMKQNRLDDYKPFEALFILTNLDDKMTNNENMINILKTLFENDKDSALYKAAKFYNHRYDPIRAEILSRGRFSEPGFNIGFASNFEVKNIQSWRVESKTKRASKIMNSI